MIQANVIADSISMSKCRLTTVEVIMPRMILAELNTHRAFSRNSASSRAIPFKKMVEKVQQSPFIPYVWTKNQKGMAADEFITDKGEIAQLRAMWLDARDKAVESAIEMNSFGLHKQVVNRILEPFLYHTVLVSSTQWHNFFKQRLSKSAEPHMFLTAAAIHRAMNASSPVLLDYDEWHLPLIQPDEEKLDITAKIMASIARCARTSYLNHNGVRAIQDDFDLYERLMQGSHFSPMEHIAQAVTLYSKVKTGNYKGWLQYRTRIKDEDWNRAVMMTSGDQEWLEMLEAA